jgi:hypothetical protein
MRVTVTFHMYAVCNVLALTVIRMEQVRLCYNDLQLVLRVRDESELAGCGKCTLHILAFLCLKCSTKYRPTCDENIYIKKS